MQIVKSVRRAAPCAAAAALVAATLGCDRMPWESKSDAMPAKADAGAPAASVARPSVPVHEQVAIVNQVPLGIGDIELATNELKQLVLSFGQQWEPLPAEDKPDALDLHDLLANVIDAELKAQDAKARGLDQKTEVKRRVSYLMRSFYAQEWDRAQRDTAAPSDNEIQTFYEQNKAAFVEPERIHVRQIATNTIAEAETVRSRAVAGENFASLARAESVGAGKDNGGDVGWFLRAFDKERLRLMGANPQEETFFPQLEPVAFALDVGQVSQPVKGPDGKSYIIKLEDRRAARQQPEVEVRDAIRELLTVQNIQRQMDLLRDAATIERFADRLESVKQP
jgi:peptidyl-prolyl cis-trans isomerase C